MTKMEPEVSRPASLALYLSKTTDLIGYSDTLRTWKKFHYKWVITLATFFMSQDHLGTIKTVTVTDQVCTTCAWSASHLRTSLHAASLLTLWMRMMCAMSFWLRSSSFHLKRDIRVMIHVRVNFRDCRDHIHLVFFIRDS